MSSSRRQFIGSLTALGAMAPLSRSAQAFAATCPFHLSVINDEITPDFGRACEIATKDFGLHWIELRSMWNKNITDLDAKEIAESKRILEKYQLRVTDIASPLFKVDWPGAPLSKSSPKRDQFHADFDFKQGQAIPNRPHPLLRFLAPGRPGPLPRRHQRQAAHGRRNLCEKQPHPPA
jgi:L-ribulose-5-phosphate 3-epimerase